MFEERKHKIVCVCTLFWNCKLERKTCAVIWICWPEIENSKLKLRGFLWMLNNLGVKFSAGFFETPAARLPEPPYYPSHYSGKGERTICPFCSPTSVQSDTVWSLVSRNVVYYCEHQLRSLKWHAMIWRYLYPMRGSQRHPLARGVST